MLVSMAIFVTFKKCKIHAISAVGIKDLSVETCYFPEALFIF